MGSGDCSGWFLRCLQTFPGKPELSISIWKCLVFRCAAPYAQLHSSPNLGAALLQTLQ